VLCFIGNAAPSRATDVFYLRELQQRAKTAALHQQRYWHLLLHYRSTITGGYESEADEPGFFLAPNGKTDPQAVFWKGLPGFKVIERCWNRKIG